MIKRSLNKMLSTSSEMKNIIYSIEGNIACGKSTVIDYVRSKNKKNVKCIQEPVSEWTNMKSGTDLLKLFYEENDKWTFAFENLVQLSRLRTYYDAQTHQAQKTFMERSILSSYNVFTINSFEENRMSKVEFDILNKYYKLFAEKLTNQTDPDAFRIVYIRTSPEVCYKRLRERNRNSETEIDLSYLTKIHLKYETWINKLEEDSKKTAYVNIIDGNCDRDQVISQIENLCLL